MELLGEPAGIVVELLASRAHGFTQVVQHRLGHVVHRPSATVIPADRELPGLVEQFAAQLVHIPDRDRRGLGGHVVKGHRLGVVDGLHTLLAAPTSPFDERLDLVGHALGSVLGEHVVILVLELAQESVELRGCVAFGSDPLCPEFGLCLARVDDGRIEDRANLGAQDRTGLRRVLGDLAHRLGGLGHRRIHAPLDQGAVVNIAHLSRGAQTLGVSGATEQGDVAAQHVQTLACLVLRLLVELAAELGEVVLQRPERHGPGLLSRGQVLQTRDPECLVDLVDRLNILTRFGCDVRDHLRCGSGAPLGAQGFQAVADHAPPGLTGTAHHTSRVHETPGQLGTEPLAGLTREQVLGAGRRRCRRRGHRTLGEPEPYRHGLGTVDHPVEQRPDS